MNVSHIRKYLKSKVGCSTIIVYYGSRNKKEVYRGILEMVYNNVFIVKMPDGLIKSFSYIDVLTKTIQMCI